MATTTTVRDEKVIVKISPAIKEKLQAYCEELGVSMSGFIAVLIGQTLKTATQTESLIKQAIEQATKDGISTFERGQN
jgi:hypothetical protein